MLFHVIVLYHPMAMHAYSRSHLQLIIMPFFYLVTSSNSVYFFDHSYIIIIESKFNFLISMLNHSLVTNNWFRSVYSPAVGLNELKD